MNYYKTEWFKQLQALIISQNEFKQLWNAVIKMLTRAMLCRSLSEPGGVLLRSHSSVWEASAQYIQQAFVPCHAGLSMESVECPYNMAASFPWNNDPRGRYKSHLVQPDFGVMYHVSQRPGGSTG